MFRIVYVSRAVSRFSDDDLVALLHLARLKNKGAGVTGMLVYSDDHFLQAIEGEPVSVITTFERISADPRHANLTTLQRGFYADQLFANWAMGFHSDQKSSGHVSVSNRIKLSALDDLSAVDFLRLCSRSCGG
jgi:hypothetical protein